MALLLQEKLDLRGISEGSEKHWDLMNTVNGFRAHNAADRQVHFDYFEGAEDGRDWGDNSEAWVAHHGLKEVWADYHLLEYYGYSTQLITWGGNGNILTNTSSCILWDGGTMNNLGFKGSAPLMHAAQLVFRKNRRSLKTTEECGILKVQTVDEIKDKLKPSSPEAKHVLTLFDQSHWAEWEYPTIWGLYDYDLLDTFTMVDEEGHVVKDEEGDDIIIDPQTPMNNRKELELLDYYMRYTVNQCIYPGLGVYFESFDSNKYQPYFIHDWHISVDTYKEQITTIFAEEKSE